jgi:hypothetical protein
MMTESDRQNNQRIETINEHADRLLRVGESDRVTADEAIACVRDSAILRAAAVRLAELEAVTAKLPRYVDTGRLLVPGDMVFTVCRNTVSDGHIREIGVAYSGEIYAESKDSPSYGPFYSTREAAEAAMKKESDQS